MLTAYTAIHHCHDYYFHLHTYVQSQSDTVLYTKRRLHALKSKQYIFH